MEIVCINVFFPPLVSETSSVASPRSLQGESTQPGPGVSDNSAQPTVPADKSRDDDKDNSTDDTNSRVLQETKGDHPAAEETKGDYPAAKETKGDNTAAEEINGDQQVAEDEKEKEVVEELSTSPSEGEESAAQSPEKSPVSEPTTDESFHTPPSPSQPAGAKLQADQPAETQPLAAEEETPSESSKTGITAATNGRGLTASDGGHVSAESGSALPTLVSREPPPLFDAEDEDDRWGRCCFLFVVVMMFSVQASLCVGCSLCVRVCVCMYVCVCVCSDQCYGMYRSVL